MLQILGLSLHRILLQESAFLDLAECEFLGRELCSSLKSPGSGLCSVAVQLLSYVQLFAIS